MTSPLPDFLGPLWVSFLASVACSPSHQTMPENNCLLNCSFFSKPFWFYGLLSLLPFCLPFSSFLCFLGAGIRMQRLTKAKQVFSTEHIPSHRLQFLIPDSFVNLVLKHPNIVTNVILKNQTTFNFQLLVQPGGRQSVFGSGPGSPAPAVHSSSWKHSLGLSVPCRPLPSRLATFLQCWLEPQGGVERKLGA